MPSLFISIDSLGPKEFRMAPEAGNLKGDMIPYWAKFSHMPCPGNIEHGPKIDYCRLGVEIENLIQFFSNVESIELGTLTLHFDGGEEMHINSDAQTIFFNSLWFILLHSNCSVFRYSQWARGSYLPSADPNRVFYMLFSIFLVEDFVLTPAKPPSIENFKAEIRMLRSVLNNLLDRIRKSSELRSDSVCNGIIMFSNLMLLLDLQFEELFGELEAKVKGNTVLGKWN